MQVSFKYSINFVVNPKEGAPASIQGDTDVELLVDVVSVVVEVVLDVELMSAEVANVSVEFEFELELLGIVLFAKIPESVSFKFFQAKE